MKNIRLGVRLGLGFGIVLLLVALIAGLSQSRLAEQDDVSQQILTDLYPKAAASQQLSYLTLDTARIVRNLILLVDEKAMAPNKAALDRNVASIETLIGTLDRLALSPEEKALVREIRTHNAAYVAFSQEVAALGLQNRNDEAQALLFGPRYAAQGAYLETLRKMVDLQEKNMSDGGVAAHADYLRARTVVWIVALAAVLIGAVCAFLITRSVMA